MSEISIYPSIMCCKPWDLKKYIQKFEENGITGIHFDVMDGHYVQNVMLGSDDFSAIASITKLPIDVHLMCVDPEDFVTIFPLRPGDRCSFHPEACRQPYRIAMKLREMGVKAGYAMSPGVPMDYVKEALPVLDFIMFMGVNPGFAGQKLIPNGIEKIARMKELLNEADHEIELIIDGNTIVENARKMLAAGATGFVTGTSSMLKEGPEAFADCYREYMKAISE